MFLIRTYLDKSPIHGLGVFAGEDIPERMVIWREIEGLDAILRPEAIKDLPQVMLDYMDTYGYYFEGRFHLNLDNAKYSNHADDPNMRMTVDGAFYACRDIRKGEEITCNYSEFSMNYEIEDQSAAREKKHVHG